MSVQDVRRCYVYRFFGRDDRLLYVGISDSPGRRFTAHERHAEWWDLAARCTLEVHPSRVDAQIAEAAAIHSEHPVWNAARPTGAAIETMAAQAVAETGDVVALVAEVERLRGIVAAQSVRLIKQRSDLDAARDAYRRMRVSLSERESELDDTLQRVQCREREYEAALASYIPASAWGADYDDDGMRR